MKLFTFGILFIQTVYIKIYSFNIDIIFYILEPFWDRQRFRASAFSLQMTSIYFTAMANGNSQMYYSETFLKLIEKAGLKVEEETNQVGVCHTLVKCAKK